MRAVSGRGWFGFRIEWWFAREDVLEEFEQFDEGASLWFRLPRVEVARDAFPAGLDVGAFPDDHVVGWGEVDDRRLAWKLEGEPDGDGDVVPQCAVVDGDGSGERDEEGSAAVVEGE